MREREGEGEEEKDKTTKKYYFSNKYWDR